MRLFTIPNLMTCGNLLCGCVGIVFSFRGDLLLSGYLILFAGILDFLDGFVARLLNQSSPIGKELDSLADMVTFGVLPSMIIFQLLERTTTSIDIGAMMLSFSAFILAVFSGLRLAKFNIDTRQSDSFIGVPTPANAILVASLPFILRNHPEYESWIINQSVLVGYTLLMSYLLICELPLLAFKFKTFGWKDNQIKYIFILLAVILLFLLKFAAVPLIVALYILLSVIAPKPPKVA
ncbi:CDP-diacylglycerol--serine O-phosphatidyltransferase [Runella sp. CRIBMP]|uniref:CDP-diacylglycerol--serine O-phosphatidyltransferase n=1 Tax=Runella sp. CRIBMP TaxID=2683261 RepID=UPI0014124CC1|nr:CDP-diacylglycerol--serine O-phosphatidyltransferase [Runella sp. CRIBMP]NBB19622.1 CDP-diacylglycerol--serine O-phosphatidyltransferase [Runella sp. CRIBMP]